MSLFNTRIFSIGGVLVAFFAINFIVNDTNTRVDLTAAKIHSISPFSIEKIANLSSDVTIRYYVSRSENTMPYELRAYADKVEFYLETLLEHSNGKLTLVRYDPTPGSDALKTANFDKITASINKEQQEFYFGLSFSSLTKKNSIPFLHPERKDQLEYDLIEAISTVAQKSYKTIGIISSLPIMGGNYNNERGQGKFSEWLIVTELKKRFEVALLGDNLESLLDNPPAILVLMHPIDFSEPSSRVIDEYLAQGGKLIVMVDPFSVAVSMIDPSQTTRFKSSTLALLFNAWGIGYNPNNVVADMLHKTEVDRGLGAETSHTMINILQRYIHKTDPITMGINSLGIANAGHIWPIVDPAELDYKLIPLVTTSENVSTVDASELVEMSRTKNQELLQIFKSDGNRRVLVAKLAGVLPRAFPVDNLVQSSKPSEVVIFTDVDFIFDPFAGESVQLSTSQRGLKPYNGNFTLFLNTIDVLLGDEAMPAIRSKSAKSYQLIGLNDIKAEIAQTHQDEFEEVMLDLNRVENQLSILSNQTKEKNISQRIEEKQSFNLLLKQRDALIQKQNTIQLKIDELIQEKLNYWQWLNIALMPIFIILLGIVVVTIRSYRTQAF